MHRVKLKCRKGLSFCLFFFGQFYGPNLMPHWNLSAFYGQSIKSKKMSSCWKFSYLTFVWQFSSMFFFLSLFFLFVFLLFIFYIIYSFMLSIRISYGLTPVPRIAMGNWNYFELLGLWTKRLETLDKEVLCLYKFHWKISRNVRE